MVILSLILSLVEIAMRVFSVVRAKRQLKKTLADENFIVNRIFRRNSTVVVAEPEGDAVAKNNAMELKKKGYLDTMLEIRSYDLGSDILAELISIYLVTAHLLMAYWFPFLINGGEGLSLDKIFTDFGTQLAFEMLTDVICIWIAYEQLGMSPMRIFTNVRDQKEVWGCFMAIVMFVAANSFDPKLGCSNCRTWDSEVCLVQ